MFFQGTDRLVAGTRMPFVLELICFLEVLCSKVNRRENALGGLTCLVSKMLGFLRFLEVLKDLERSGRLAGKNEANFIEIRLVGAEL